jgi:predicted thioredoxin/glutaredoxin
VRRDVRTPPPSPVDAASAPEAPPPPDVVMTREVMVTPEVMATPEVVLASAFDPSVFESLTGTVSGRSVVRSFG